MLLFIGIFLVISWFQPRFEEIYMENNLSINENEMDDSLYVVWVDTLIISWHYLSYRYSLEYANEVGDGWWLREWNMIRKLRQMLSFLKQFVVFMWKIDSFLHFFGIEFISCLNFSWLTSRQCQLSYQKWHAFHVVLTVVYWTGKITVVLLP